MLIINDLHIASFRSGGTTPRSQAELRDYLRESMSNLIASEQKEITINGDLFDSFSVEPAEVIKTYEILAKWLGDTGSTLNLIQGNHDWNPRGDKTSSFHLLAFFLQNRFFSQVQVFDEGFDRITSGVYCIPHMPNQAAFDAEIKIAQDFSMEDESKFLLLHCNYKNGHTENSDHSLNLSSEQVEQLMLAGWTLIIGHEHIGYSLRGGRVVVVGNQFPSSIADCIGNSEKHALLIEDGQVKFKTTWKAEDNYYEVDWRDMEVGMDCLFIRVTGEATANEAADVIKAVSQLRQRHDAFVITNAVKVEGVSSDFATESIESLKAFDVVGAIMEELNEQEQECVKGLLNA